MKLYAKYISYIIKGQMQYKVSFLLMLISQFFAPFVSLAGIYLLFDRFNSIQGWMLYEVLVCYGVVGASFAVSTCFARGFDTFPDMVKKGSFDRILVRPRNEILQILGSSFDLKRIGHLVQSAAVLIIAVIGADIEWSALKIITVFNMILGGSVIFTGVYLLQAAASFWTTEGLEAANILTHGMKEHASYPLNIFPKWITAIFTFIIPFGTINYLPMQYLAGKIGSEEWLYAFLPLLGILFIIPCLLMWRIGVKHYTSTGS